MAKSDQTQPEQRGVPDSARTLAETTDAKNVSLSVGTELLRRVDSLLGKTTSGYEDEDEDDTSRSFRVALRNDGSVQMQGPEEVTVFRGRIQETTRPRIDLQQLRSSQQNDSSHPPTEHVPAYREPLSAPRSENSDTAAFAMGGVDDSPSGADIYHDEDDANDRTQHLSPAEIASLQGGPKDASRFPQAERQAAPLFYDEEVDGSETQQMSVIEAAQTVLRNPPKRPVEPTTQELLRSSANAKPFPPLRADISNPLPPLVSATLSQGSLPSMPLPSPSSSLPRSIPSTSDAKDAFPPPLSHSTGEQPDSFAVKGEGESPTSDDLPSAASFEDPAFPVLSSHTPPPPPLPPKEPVVETRDAAKKTWVDGMDGTPWKQTVLDSAIPPLSIPKEPDAKEPREKDAKAPSAWGAASGQMPRLPQIQTIAQDAQESEWNQTVIRASSLKPKDYQSSSGMPIPRLSAPTLIDESPRSPSLPVLSPPSTSSSLAPLSTQTKSPLASPSSAASLASAISPPLVMTLPSAPADISVLSPLSLMPPPSAPSLPSAISPPLAAPSPSAAAALSAPLAMSSSSAISPPLAVSAPSVAAQSAHGVTRTFVKGTVLPRKNQEGTLVAVAPEEKDRYEPLQMLGEGGVGQVLLVRDHDILRLAAMKRLKGNKTESTLMRFLEEIRHTGQLEHPNIVPIHDVGMDEEGQYYFIMKYVQGEDLSTIIEKLRAGDPTYHKRYTFERRTRMFLDIVEAVRFAHNKQIIHRDLKPGNIRVGAYGEVMVMDWGLSKPFHRVHGDFAKTLQGALPVMDAADQRLFETRQGILVGTPAYMSPEQAYGKHDAMDQRSDIYSLGVLFYELTTLFHPFEQCETLESLLGSITQTDPSPAWSVVHPAQGRVPRELGFMIAKAMARDPAERYPSLEPWAAELEAYLDARSGVYCTSTFVKRGVQGYSHFLDSHRIWAVTLLCLVVLSSLFGSVQFVRWLFSWFG